MTDTAALARDWGSSFLSWETKFTVCVFLAGKLAKTMLLSLHSEASSLRQPFCQEKYKANYLSQSTSLVSV